MAGRAAIARVLCAVALFSFAFLISPHRVGADGEAAISSAGPLTQILISTDLNCQVAYSGDLAYEFFPGDSTTGSCGTFLAVGGTLYGPSYVPSGTFSSVTPWTPVSQSPVAGSGSSEGDPFRISTVVDAIGSGLRLEEVDSYAVGSRSYKTELRITNQGQSAAAAVLYRAGDCYLQENDTGFGRVDGGAPACIVDPSNGSRIEQWLPVTVGSHYMESGYSDVYDWIDTQQQFPNTCVCDTALDNGAGLSWPVNVAPGQTVIIDHETFFSPVGRGPVTQSLVGSVPDPTQITLDPVVLAESAALTAGVIVLVPFPSALFNNTLEENYAEVMGWLARMSAGANGLWARVVAWVRRQIASRRSTPSSSASAVPPAEHPFLNAAPAPPTPSAMTAPSAKDPWQSPLRIVGFVLVTALLYAFLDPTFGLSLSSLAELAGLAVGLGVVTLAWAVPLGFFSRRDHFPLTVRALPATLLVGVACVLISRLADFQPGYLYGLIVGFYLAHGLAQAIEGRAKAVAVGTTLVVALLAWIGLAVLRASAAGGADFDTVLLQSAAVTVVVAGLENAVFAMLPLRFMPGASIFSWNRPVWVVLMAIGLFGFVHVLLNPAAGAGYLADATRTSFFTTVALLALFGITSVLFWAYFRFRRHAAPNGHPPTAEPPPA